MTLHSFVNTDGNSPVAGVTQGADGNLYGTAMNGGTGNAGTIFKITPAGIFTTLYNFSGSDGRMPQGKLVLANDGNFYGTTQGGGDFNAGVVFKITPAGDFTKLFSFNGTAQGAFPLAGVMQAKDGYLYGTTSLGGANVSGTIFQISLDGNSFKTLYNFCQQSACVDGSMPAAALIQGSDGNLYGTTQGGGTSQNCSGSGCGTVFKITPQGTLTSLHSFVAPDGAAPLARLLQASDGLFYGTTSHGGSTDYGTVFRISSSGTLFTTLHNFCSNGPCSDDGTNPYAGLVQASDGSLYGTTGYGGASNAGTIFSISPAGSYNTLHIFNFTDGANPAAELVQNSDAIFFGTTQLGGSQGAGTIFSISPSGMQFVPVTPCRVVDTRNPNGKFGGPFIGGGIGFRSFPIPQGACNIPPTATAYSLNVTLVPLGPVGYVTVWPSGTTRPLVSTMNSYDGRVKADAVVMPAGSSGAVSVYSTDPTHVVIDINGYFTLSGSSTLAFFPVTPCRVADTRDPKGPLGGPFIPANSSRDFPVLSSSCGLPPAALAYSMNFTAVPHGPLGFLTVWPSDQQQPYVSTLNAYSGQTTANAAIVPAAQNGDISAFVSNDSDLIIDVNGYFAPPTVNGLSLYTLTPCRALDTRYGSGAFSGELTVNIKGSGCPVPSSAQGYIFNATVLPKNVLGYLSLWADLQQQPHVSTLNSWDGAVTSNMAIVPTTNGSIDAFASDLTDLLLDITSYFAP